MEKIMREITNNMYRVHRGTYKAGKWSGNFSETTIHLLPGGEWHMHMWGELPKCCHHKGKNGSASRWSDQVLQSLQTGMSVVLFLQFTITTGVHQNW